MEGVGGSGLFLVLVLITGYFMLWRPNRKNIERHRALIESVEVGDEIVTIGGIIGTVTTITDDEFHLEIAPGTVVRFGKRFIGGRVDPETETQAELEASSEESEGTTA